MIICCKLKKKNQIVNSYCKLIVIQCNFILSFQFKKITKVKCVKAFIWIQLKLLSYTAEKIKQNNFEHGNLIAKMKPTHKTSITSRKDKNGQLSIHLEPLVSLFVIQLLKLNSFKIELYFK